MSEFRAGSSDEETSGTADAIVSSCRVPLRKRITVRAGLFHIAFSRAMSTGTQWTGKEKKCKVCLQDIIPAGWIHPQSGRRTGTI